MTANGSPESDASHGSRESIARSLIVGALFVGAAAALIALSPEHLGAELSRRLLGVLMGAVLVVYANAAPKALVPLARMRRDPAAEQAVRRFTAWSLVLGGAAYALAWALAPMEHATVLATSLLGAALLLVAVRIAWGKARGSRA